MWSVMVRSNPFLRSVIRHLACWMWDFYWVQALMNISYVIHAVCNEWLRKSLYVFVPFLVEIHWISVRLLTNQNWLLLLFWRHQQKRTAFKRPVEDKSCWRGKTNKNAWNSSYASWPMWQSNWSKGKHNQRLLWIEI